MLEAHYLSPQRFIATNGPEILARHVSFSKLYYTNLQFPATIAASASSGLALGQDFGEEACLNVSRKLFLNPSHVVQVLFSPAPAPVTM